MDRGERHRQNGSGAAMSLLRKRADWLIDGKRYAGTFHPDPRAAPATAEEYLAWVHNPPSASAWPRFRPCWTHCRNELGGSEALAALADVGIDRRSRGTPAGTKSRRRRGMGSTRDDAGRFGVPRSGTDRVPPRRTAACIGNGLRTRKSAPESLPDASWARAPEGFGADPGHEPRPLGLVHRIRGAPRGMD